MESPDKTTLKNTHPFMSYPRYDGHFDEAYNEQRQVRPHWKYLVDSINSLGPEVLHERQRKAQRILRDDGATYNLTTEPLASNLWGLDPIPMVISSEEWSRIETGLIERSELMDLLLKDIYGPRELIKHGILPAEIVYGHPGFLRQCSHMESLGNHTLLLHAVDMVRQPDGQLCIIGDRTQAPSGAGYALENRTVLSRIMPSLFRDSQVHRLSLFFQTLRSTLSAISPTSGESPFVVILTPGAYSETYFEHAYLSNYLGYPLVQGSDLTVRQGKVWLKSLNGLSQVDVILRRVDDIYCDQVELKSDSYLGVPGLLEAARAGNVVIANPLGSGILEAPALLKYLSAISEFLLGRQLELPSVKTWWCGDEDDFNYIQKNLSTLIIKPAIRQAESPSVYGHLLTEQTKKSVLERIRREPYNYVAQSYIAPSLLPAWQNKNIQPRPSILRTFTVSNQTSYTVMSGGLTRVGTSDQDTIVTNQTGSQSKDTWIIASEPEKQVSLVPLTGFNLPATQQTNLPSRVVENMFWMGRYAERAESSLRLLRTIFMQLNGIDPLPMNNQTILLRAITHLSGTQPGFTEENSSLLKEPDNELISLIIDDSRPGTLKSNLLSLLTCTEEVKEMLSADTRRIINDLRDHLHELDRAFVSGLPSAPDESLDPLVTSLLALSGLNHESMLRGTGWQFQEIGRRTERAVQTAILLKHTLSEALPEIDQQQILESVLLSVEALISFRRRYRNRADVSCGLAILLVEESNPRSLYYQLDTLRTHLEMLPERPTQSLSLSREKWLIIKSLNDIQLCDLAALSQENPTTGQRASLVTLLDMLIAQLGEFSTIISDQYFDHTTNPQQLVAMQWNNAL